MSESHERPRRPQRSPAVQQLGRRLGQLERDTINAWLSLGVQLQPEQVRQMLLENLRAIWPHYLRGEMLDALGYENAQPAEGAGDDGSDPEPGDI